MSQIASSYLKLKKKEFTAYNISFLFNLTIMAIYKTFEYIGTNFIKTPCMNVIFMHVTYCVAVTVSVARFYATRSMEIYEASPKTQPTTSNIYN